MQESDYFEDLGDDADGDASDEGDEGAPLPRKKDKLAGELEELALGLDAAEGATHVEQLARDVSRLSEGQRLALLKTQAPELLGMVAELRERLQELRDGVTPLRALAAAAAADADDDDDDSDARHDLFDYLEAKEQLLLSYATNVLFYLHMKAQGASVRAHPVMRQLLELRYAMERMRGLDKKMRPRVEALRQGSAAPAARRAKPQASKPSAKAAVVVGLVPVSRQHTNQR